MICLEMGKRKRVVIRGPQEPVPKRQVSMPLAAYRPARAWIEACGTAVEMIRQILRHTLGASWTVIPQGSFVQGLQLTGSDLDLVLLDGTDRWRSMNRNRTADELETAVRRLTRAQFEGFPIRINVIRKIYRARVPLARLRVVLPSQEVEVDLCFGDANRGLCDQFVHRIVSRVSQLEHFCLAMKVWANARKLTETHTGGISCFAIVLLAIFFYRQHGFVLEEFFQFVLSLRHKSNVSVSVETQQLVPRPADGYKDLMHVAVPCRANENAARCLSHSVWVRLFAPELRRGLAICKANKDKSLDIEFMTSQLLNRSDIRPVHAGYAVSESEGSDGGWEVPTNPAPVELGDDDSDDTVDESAVVEKVKAGNGQSVAGVVELDSDTSDWSGSVASSVDSARVVAAFEANKLPGRTDHLGRLEANPITINECDECSYFSFNKSDLRNHQYAVHGYQMRAVSTEKEVERYRIPRNLFKDVVHPYAAPLDPVRKRNKAHKKRKTGHRNEPPESFSKW